MDVFESLGAILDDKSSKPSDYFYVVTAPLTNAEECDSFVKRFFVKLGKHKIDRLFNIIAHYFRNEHANLYMLKFEKCPARDKNFLIVI